MTCEKAFDRYLDLDKNERVPFLVTLHLLVCPACRTGVRCMTRAEQILAVPLSPARAKPALDPANSALEEVDDPVIHAALERIAAAGLSYPVLEDEGRVSLFRWLVSGVILAGGFAVIPFSSIGEWGRTVFGNSFSVPFYLLCGIAVTAYCGLFIGTNIDFFVKKFGSHRFA